MSKPKKKSKRRPLTLTEAVETRAHPKDWPEPDNRAWSGVMWATGWYFKKRKCCPKIFDVGPHQLHALSPKAQNRATLDRDMERVRVVILPLYCGEE